MSQRPTTDRAAVLTALRPGSADEQGWNAQASDAVRLSILANDPTAAPAAATAPPARRAPRSSTARRRGIAAAGGHLPLAFTQTFAGWAGDWSTNGVQGVDPDTAQRVGSIPGPVTSGSTTGARRPHCDDAAGRAPPAAERSGASSPGEVTSPVDAPADLPSTAVRAATTGAGAGGEHALTGQLLDTMGIGYAVFDADWTIRYVNTETERMTGTSDRALVGQNHWEAFPAMAGSDFERHYRRAVETGEVVVFEAHYPAPLDVWAEVRAIPHAGGLQVSVSDVSARHHAQDTSRRAHERLDGLSALASALLGAETVDDLVAVVAELGLTAVGCDGGAVAVVDPADPTQLLSRRTGGRGPRAGADVVRLRLDARLPECAAAAGDQRVLVADRTAALAYSPLVAGVLDATGCQSFAHLPLRATTGVVGVLSAWWRGPQAFAFEQLDLLETFADQCAQALSRLLARDAEQAATRSAQQAAVQQAALVGIARSLGDVESEDDVLAVVAAQGTELLSANGAGLCLLQPGGGRVRTLVTGGYAPVRDQIALVPVDFPLPAVHSAATGTTHFLSDRSETEELFPGSEAVYTAVDVQASAAVPLRARGRLLGCLSVGFVEARTWTAVDRELLEAFAAMTAQALDRIDARDAERAANAVAAGFSETMQRSLLTDPPQPDDLEIAVRYAPATAHAEVGGDWYDAFMTAAGTTSVVIGDVTGHDIAAAAVMAQLRNLLRGIAYAVGHPPAAVLSLLDDAAQALGIETVTTAVLAQVEQDAAHRAAGTRVLRWSNAGHLPPLLVEPGGVVRFLEAPTDLVLGWARDVRRHDHEVVLQPGAVVLLYTDGLVERRGTDLRQGLAWLSGAVEQLVAAAPGGAVGVEELCDALLAQVHGHLDDDVALLALCARAQDDDGHPSRGPAGTV